MPELAEVKLVREAVADPIESGASLATSRPWTIRGRDVLCFSHDWTGDPLSKTHLMRLLARHNRVLWVNSIGYRTPSVNRRDLKRAFSKLKAASQPVREVEPNLYVLNPLVIPAYGVPAVSAFNRRFLRWQVKRTMKRLGFRRPLNWVFNPAAAMIAGTLGEDRLIYYCVDEYSAFSGVAAESLAAMELQLLRKADLVIVSAERLFDAKAPINPNTALVRHGVDYEHFRKATETGTRVPEELAQLPRPIIGYFGLIASDWIDLPLLMRIAESFPNASIVMLGKITMDVSSLRRFANVHLLGRKPYEALPAYCKGFDVALIPFPINEATLNSNPLKAREYLAAGLPVVSTAIPEVEILGKCRVARDHESFVQQLREALASPGPSRDRSHSMASEGWEARLNEVCRLLSMTPEHRSNAAPTATLTDPNALQHRAARANCSSGLFANIRFDLRRKAAWLYEREDAAAVFQVLLTDGTAAMIFYRLMQWARRRRLLPLELLFNKLNTVLCNCIIGRGADFGSGFVLIHATGVVINSGVRGGSNVYLEHQVTIGAEQRQTPQIGNNVFIGAGAKVIGAVNIGDGARVGANAVVVDDVPAHTTVVGIPARIVRQRAVQDDRRAAVG